MIEAIGILVGVAAVFLFTAHGYVNLVDRIGLFLRRHANAVRQRHLMRERELKGMWRADRGKRIGPVLINKEKLG